MNTQSNKSKSVLIADDDPVLVAHYAARCESLGMKVSTANNIREASLVFDEGFPDLLIINDDLKAENNRSLLDCLAAYEDTRDIPVILLCEDLSQEPTQAEKTLVTYRVHKSAENWQQIEMFIFELIDLDKNINL